MQIAGEFVVRRFGKVKALTVSDAVLLKTLIELFPEYVDEVKKYNIFEKEKQSAKEKVVALK